MAVCMAAGVYSSIRVRRAVSRCGWNRSWYTPGSEASSAPAAISGGQATESRT